MAQEIIIDGYNLLRKSPELIQAERLDLQTARKQLIEMLRTYKTIKPHKISLVFDGHSSGTLTQKSHMEKGIRVIFTQHGVTADSVIKNLADNSKNDLIIVTSDFEVKTFVKKCGKVIISSEDFLAKIEMAQYMSVKGATEEDEYSGGKITTKKKGNPNRLSKKERQKNRKLKKL